MPLEVLTVSQHAQSRYRLHHPTARPADILLAVQLAVPMERSLAFSLVGRRAPAPHESGAPEEHRLHITGKGIFVVCGLPDQPGRGFVRTYLRLDTAEQQRMACAWFLDPIGILQAAFEMGFQAARSPDAPPLAAQATQAHRAALAALAPRLAASTPPTPPPTPPPEPPPMMTAAPVPQGARCEITVWGATWTARATHQLRNLSGQLHDLNPDLTTWLPLSSAQVARLLASPHVPPLTGVVGGYRDPSFRCVAFLAVLSGGPEVAAVISVPHALRDPAEAVLPVTEGEREGGVSVPEAVQVVCAEHLAVSSWSTKALSEAHAAGFAHVPVAWLGQLDAVAIEELPRLAAQLRWSLASGTYAARRSGRFVLLLRKTERSPAATVIRCGALEPALAPAYRYGEESR